MKARPLENLYEYHQNLLDKYLNDFSECENSEIVGWINCIKYILENYDCKAKEIV